MQILLISGKAESGKDSAAQIIKEELEKQDNKVAILHFAKYIKDYLKTYEGWDGIKTEYWRQKLQKLGTDTIRQKLNMPLFHVNRVVEDIKVLSELGYETFIIPDARFINEIAFVIANFPNETKSVRVHRLNYISNLTKEQLNHPSETNLDNYKFDYNIYCQSGLDHLKDETLRVLKDIV